jgi:lysophospholipase L1-like esterase
MSLYEHGVCLGDSLTAGARSRYGVAESLADQLNRASGKRWLFRNGGVNGDTVLQLLRRMDQAPWVWRDVTFCTLVIGTNDAKSTVNTPREEFRMLLGQVLDRLVVGRQLVFPALIPDLQIGAGLASPYDSSCVERIARFNEGIRAECHDRGLDGWLVDLTGLPAECYVDGVHFSAAGVEEVARRFAKRIASR